MMSTIQNGLQSSCRPIVSVLKKALCSLNPYLQVHLSKELHVMVSPSILSSLEKNRDIWI